MPEKNHKLIANYFRIASIIGILLLMVLQFLWFKNAYKMVDQEMMEKCKICLREAINDELFERMDKLSIEFEVQKTFDYNDSNYQVSGIGNVEKLNDVNLVLQEMLYTSGSVTSLNRVDTIFLQKTKSLIGYQPKYKILIIKDSINNNYQLLDKGERDLNTINSVYSNLKNKNKINNSIKNYDLIENHKIKSRINSKNLILLDIQPTSIIFIDKARFLLLASVLIVLLIGFIMISQLRTVLREHRFVQFIKEYTSSITHDLQTPMNNISMAIEILSLGKLDNDVKLRENYFRICKEQSERQTNNIRKIMFLAKSEQSFITLEKSRIVLKDYLESILDNYRKGILYSNEHITFNLECRPENLEVNIDADLFESVMNNLIDNAIKYSYEKVEIEISCVEIGNTIQIIVKDHGLGISAQNLDKIFKYLERGSQVENKRLIGYGIGLSFVEKIISAHKGSISVNSVEEVGSEFIITLPKS